MNFLLGWLTKIRHPFTTPLAIPQLVMQPRFEHTMRRATQWSVWIIVWLLRGQKIRERNVSILLTGQQKQKSFYALKYTSEKPKLKFCTDHFFAEANLNHDRNIQYWCSENFYITSCEYVWDFHINGFLLSPDLYLFILQPKDEPFLHLSLIGFPI